MINKYPQNNVMIYMDCNVTLVTQLKSLLSIKPNDWGTIHQSAKTNPKYRRVQTRHNNHTVINVNTQRSSGPLEKTSALVLISMAPVS